jgi:hypothetical protein
MPTARAQAAKQQKAALNIGTAASKGGGTGSAKQNTGSPHKAAKKQGTSASSGAGIGSPSPSKRPPPKDRSPAIGETGSPTLKKKKKTKPDSAVFATVTPIVLSDTTGEKESAAGEDESCNAGKVIVGKDDEGDDDAGTKIAGENDGGKDDAGQAAAGTDAAGKADSGQDGAGNANISSPDSDKVLNNPRKRTISKTALDGVSSPDSDEDLNNPRKRTISKTALDGVSNASKSSGNSYHFIIFI